MISESTGSEEKSSEDKCFSMDEMADLYLLTETGASKEDKEVCQSHYRWINGNHLPFETPIHPSVPTVIVERLCGSAISSTDSLGRSFRKSCLLETSLQQNQVCRLNISGFGWVRREWGWIRRSCCQVWSLEQPAETTALESTGDFPSMELSEWPSKSLSPFSVASSKKGGWEEMHTLTFPPRTGTSHPLPKLRGHEMETQRSVVDCLVSWQTDLCAGLPRSEKSEKECPFWESTLYKWSAPSSRVNLRVSSVCLERIWLSETPVASHTTLAAWLPWTTRFETWPPPSFVQISHHGCVVCQQQHLAAWNYLTKGFQS